MFLNTNHIPSLPFCGPHTKPHGVRGSCKHYHIQFDTKLGHGKFTIRLIPCACDEDKAMIDKPRIHDFLPQQQPHYQPVRDCTYWQVLGYFISLNIITLSHKATKNDHFEDIHLVVLYGISYNMYSLVQLGKYGAINTTDEYPQNDHFLLLFVTM